MISLLPHHESERQWCINSFRYCTLGNEGITQILELYTELLTFFISKNGKYKKRKLLSKIIDIANCKTCNKWLLDIEDMILIWYYCQLATTNALYESTDSSTGQPADNHPNSEVLGDFPCNLPEVLVWVYWQSRSWILNEFISDLDPDLIRQSCMSANTL